MVKQKDKRFSKIVHVHPGKPLASIAQWTAQKIFKKRNHLAQRTTVFTKYNAETGDDHTYTFSLCLLSLLLPIISQPGEKIIAERRCFGELLIFTKTVISHR